MSAREPTDPAEPRELDADDVLPPEDDDERIVDVEPEEGHTYGE